MRIVEIRATAIEIPTRRAMHYAGGQFVGLANVLVEVVTADGLVGMSKPIGMAVRTSR